MEVRYIRYHDEQQKISRSCHVDPTSGQLGIKKTLSRIRELLKGSCGQEYPKMLSYSE